MKTYKILSYIDDHYISPVTGTVWVNGEMHICPDGRHGVYSCETPINRELFPYVHDNPNPRLVVLDVWGDVETYDNGVIVSEHAAIVREISLQELLGWIIADPTPELAVYYAALSKQDQEIMRSLACQSPMTAYHYALEIGKPGDDTRAAACRDPRSAYCYAENIDRCPRDDTRAAACGDPYWAWLYAKYVDRCPRDDTRAAACRDCETALWYAQYVDQAYHPITWRAVSKFARLVSVYKTEVLKDENL